MFQLTLAFMIADLSSVWIVANVPEEDAGQLQKGMEVTVRIPALHQREIIGRLSFVSPIVDLETRTVEVRMDAANAGGDSKARRAGKYDLYRSRRLAS